MRSWAAAITLLLATAFLSNGVPQSAAAAVGGTISGKVTLPAGEPLASLQGIYVDAWNGEEGLGTQVDPTTGAYSLTDLPAGDYRVSFSVNSYWDEKTSKYVTPNLVAEYYNNTFTYTDASLVTVTAGVTKSGINAALEKGAIISGKVTLPAGEPVASLQGVTVTADGTTWVSGVVDPSTGSYQITGLPAGDYRVSFGTSNYWDQNTSQEMPAPNLIPQYYGGTADVNAATLVSMTAGGTRSGINATLVKGAVVSGKITLPIGEPSASLKGVRVAAESTSGSPLTTFANVDPVSGAYSVTGLAAGDYTIRFSAESYWDDSAERMVPAPNFVTEYYNNVTDASKATLITLTAGGTRSGINAALDKGASISGKVSLPPGESAVSLQGVTVFVTDGPTYASAEVDSSTGEYRVTGLPAGEYIVIFQVNDWWNGSEMVPAPNLISEYFDNTTDYTKAAKIALGAGGSRTGVNATLEKGGTITGKISLPAGEPISSYRGVSVHAWNENNTVGINGSIDPATGNYTVTGLTAGSYTVSFELRDYFDDSSQTMVEGPNLLSEYYDDTTDFTKAKKVTVSTGAIVSGINATLAKGTTLSGALTVPSGYEAGWLGVRPATSQTSVDAYGQPFVDAYARVHDGKYTIKRLSPGDYYVTVSLFNDDTWAQQYAQKTGTSSYKVTVPATGATVNITTKPLDAKIEGTLTASGFSSNATGDKFLADVVAYQKLDTGWVKAPSTIPATKKNGATAYSIPGLAAGTYTVGFQKSQTPYSATATLKEQWWKNRTSLATADAIVLAGAQTRTGIDGAVSPTTTEPPAPTTGFTDVSSTPGSSAYSAFAAEIAWMSEQGISTGYDVGGGKKQYRPFGTVTRDAMAAFLYRAAGSPAFTAPANSPFTDVSPSSSFYKEITWLASTGITTGWDVGGGKKEFRPFANITRDAMAAFLYRYAEQPAFSPPAKTPFADVPVSNGFYKEITWLASTGISTGWDANGKKEFRPYNAITRDAMAAFLYRYAHLD